MPRADWTYELPPASGDSVWLEEYLVYDRDGEPAGKVFAVLEREGGRWLGIEREHLPLAHDRRAVPYDAIGEVDHENLAVHLTLAAAELDGVLELDPANGVEQGGEARRVVEPPAAELPPQRDAGAPGPVDRPLAVYASLLLLCGLITLLGAIALYGAARISVAWFAIPIAFFLAAAAVGYRAWAQPWRRRAAARRHPPPRR
ncbi:MAG TPA: hypothetical protein VFJ77_08030 [Gaiellaceae bacterium]|nr:hypothetical protein [Gaiellaceae bacterium]